MSKKKVENADSMAASKEKADELIEKNANRNGWQEGSPADDLMDAIILDSCGKNECMKKLGNKNVLYSVEYLAENLPAVAFVSEFYLELIMHGGILAKDDHNQKKLDEWLSKRNVLGQTNGNVIREALLNSIIYGYAGLRDVMGDLLYISPNHFRIWKIPATAQNRPIPGVKAPLFYEVMVRPSEKVDKNGREHVFAVDDDKFTRDEVVKERELKKGVDGSYFLDDGRDGASVSSVYIPTENFCHLRHSDDGDYGKSPLTTDRLRTTMIVDYLKNIIDEINNDGNDYIMYLKQRQIAGSSLSSSFSTDDVEIKTTSSSDAKQTKTAREKQMNAARELALKLKRTAKTRIGIVDKSWVEEIKKLEGTVKLPEYLKILDEAKGVVADIYGIPAMLAGSSGGGWSTGMSALIPFTLERTIKPFQQRYAEQLTPIIQKCAGVRGDLVFKEINWEDEKTRAEIDKLIAEKEKLLAEANKAAADKAKTSKETRLLTSDGVNGRNQNQDNSSKQAKSTKKTK